MNLKDLKNSNTLVTIYIDDLSNLTTLEETFYSISKQSYPIDLLVLCPKTLADNLNPNFHILKNTLDSPKIVLRKQNEKGELEEEVLTTDGKINYIILDSASDTFPKIFNEGFNIALENEYEFYSIIEANDVVGLNWYANANIYAKENANISMFFPLIRNTVNGVFSSLINEAPWAEGMSEEAGKVDSNLLSRFNCIIPIGAIFKVKSLEEYSELKDDNKHYPFKESIKISHYYEFLMRMIYNDVKAMCVPRIGYEFKITNCENFKHTGCKIPNNLSQIPVDKGGITPAEGSFWMSLAKKEYFFDEDRNKVYEEAKQ